MEIQLFCGIEEREGAEGGIFVVVRKQSVSWSLLYKSCMFLEHLIFLPVLLVSLFGVEVRLWCDGTGSMETETISLPPSMPFSEYDEALLCTARVQLCVPSRSLFDALTSSLPPITRDHRSMKTSVIPPHTMSMS